MKICWHQHYYVGNAARLITFCGIDGSIRALMQLFFAVNELVQYAWQQWHHQYVFILFTVVSMSDMIVTKHLTDDWKMYSWRLHFK